MWKLCWACDTDRRLLVEWCYDVVNEMNDELVLHPRLCKMICIPALCATSSLRLGKLSIPLKYRPAFSSDRLWAIRPCNVDQNVSQSQEVSLFETTRIVLEFDRTDTINTQDPSEKNLNVLSFEHYVMANQQATMTDLMMVPNKVTGNAFGNLRPKKTPI